MEHAAILPVPPTPSSKKREKSVIMLWYFEIPAAGCRFALPHQNNTIGPNTSVIQIDFAQVTKLGKENGTEDFMTVVCSCAESAKAGLAPCPRQCSASACVTNRNRQCLGSLWLSFSYPSRMSLLVQDEVQPGTLNLKSIYIGGISRAITMNEIFYLFTLKFQQSKR